MKERLLQACINGEVSIACATSLDSEWDKLMKTIGLPMELNLVQCATHTTSIQSTKTPYTPPGPGKGKYIRKSRNRTSTKYQK
jgi:hypothetical protein